MVKTPPPNKPAASMRAVIGSWQLPNLQMKIVTKSNNK
jgi:hypothetical protein